MSTKTGLLTALGFVLAVVLGPVNAFSADNVTITGSTTVLPIAQKAAEDFMKKHPGVNITVSGTGSGDGIKSILDGTADIGDSSREIEPKETELAKQKGVTVKEFTVALDCIVPVVNPANPVKDLTIAQLGEIYTGKVKNWKEVGGENKPIVVVSRDSSSGTFEVWNERVLLKQRVRPDAQLQASNGAVAQTVAGNKYAIGYVGIGYLNAQLKGLTVGGITASPATAKNKTYPIARSLYMYTGKEPQGQVKAFLDFVKSPEGQKIVAEEGFVTLQ